MVSKEVAQWKALKPITADVTEKFRGELRDTFLEALAESSLEVKYGGMVEMQNEVSCVWTLFIMVYTEKFLWNPFFAKEGAVEKLTGLLRAAVKKVYVDEVVYGVELFSASEHSIVFQVRGVA